MKLKTFASKSTNYNTIIKKENFNDIIDDDLDEINLIENNNNDSLISNENKENFEKKENNENLANISFKNALGNKVEKNKSENEENEIGFKINKNLEEKQIEFIKNILITNGFNEEFDLDTIYEFAIGFFSIEFDENKIIFEENNEAKLFYIIEEGKILLTSEKNNSEKVLSKGDFFGIESFEDFSYRNETAKTLINTKLLSCSGEFYRNAQNYMLLKTLNEKIEILKSVPLF